MLKKTIICNLDNVVMLLWTMIYTVLMHEMWLFSFMLLSCYQALFNLVWELNKTKYILKYYKELKPWWDLWIVTSVLEKSRSNSSYPAINWIFDFFTWMHRVFHAVFHAVFNFVGNWLFNEIKIVFQKFLSILLTSPLYDRFSYLTIWNPPGKGWAFNNW